MWCRSVSALGSSDDGKYVSLWAAWAAAHSAGRSSGETTRSSKGADRQQQVGTKGQKLNSEPVVRHREVGLKVTTSRTFTTPVLSLTHFDDKTIILYHNLDYLTPYRLHLFPSSIIHEVRNNCFLFWSAYLLRTLQGGRVRREVNQILGMGWTTPSSCCSHTPDQTHDPPANAFCFKVRKNSLYEFSFFSTHLQFGSQLGSSGCDVIKSCL